MARGRPKTVKKKSSARKTASQTPRKAAKSSAVSKTVTKRAPAEAKSKKSVAGTRSPEARAKSAKKAKAPAKKQKAAKRVSKKTTRAAVRRRTPPGSAVAPSKPRLTLVEDEETDSLPQTRLSPEELATFRQMLLDKRAELIGDVDNLTNEALRRSRSEAAGDLSSMPIHMADIGSDNWEQEFTLGLIDNERALLQEIDEALQRISERTYGICLATHKPISVTRLRAKPWAKYCIEYARLREQGRTP